MNWFIRSFVELQPNDFLTNEFFILKALMNEVFKRDDNQLIYSQQRNELLYGEMIR